MSETDFDIIVVGSGCAGAVAAYVAAKAGKSVLAVERGQYAGAKNMTGGRIYSHALREVFPDFENEAPLERKITHERISMMTRSSNMTVDYMSSFLGQKGCDSYSVLRAPFDQWLASKAETAGAEFIYGIAVEGLMKDGKGTVCGIRAGEDEITAQVVIIADGVNSLLSCQATGAPKPAADEMAVGIKEVYELPEGTITDRFLCADGEGAAWLFVGDCTHGNTGGGFLYTNKGSISIGLVSTVSSMAASDTTICQALDDFKRHPAIAPVLQGAKMVEHSGHMVPEGGYDMVPPYIGDGVLLAGDTAMFCMNLGYMVRGMDLAVASGRMAAEAACKAIDAGDVSAAELKSYRVKLEDSFVMKDLRTFRSWPGVMGDWNALFCDYPQMVSEVFESMFIVDGAPQIHLKQRVMPIIRQRGLIALLREMKGAVKAL